MTEPLPTDHRLSGPESVMLAHACVAQVARTHDIRGLFIKGPSLSIQGLRPYRDSSDVDVLCDPRMVSPLIKALEQLGWKDLNPRRELISIVKHATAMVHDDWQCSVDIHRKFPGFCAPDQQVFEALWERRSSVVIAHQPIPTCDLHGASLVAALHLERNPELALTISDREFLVAALQGRLNREGLRELAELAAATGAADTLAPFLDRVGAPAIGRGSSDPKEVADWNLHKAGKAAPGLVWLEELRQHPLRRWPQVVRRALAVMEPELLASRGVRTWPAKARYVLSRCLRAIRMLPSALREWRRLGNGRT